jgi:hypothetical protein
MSTLTLHTRLAPNKASRGVDRLFKSVLTFFDVLAEAQQMAADAHKRLPFASW